MTEFNPFAGLVPKAGGRRCTYCQEWRPDEQFRPRDPADPAKGTRERCRWCEAEEAARRRLSPDSREKRRAYYERNKEAIKARSKARYEKLTAAYAATRGAT